MIHINHLIKKFWEKHNENINDSYKPLNKKCLSNIPSRWLISHVTDEAYDILKI